jgi:UDP-N-acetylmuramyl tripeptide synthase
MSNLLAAVAVGLDLGVRPHQVKQGIEECQPIPGRFEAVDCGQPFHVFVDYAHTPDALEKVLQTARELHRSVCWLCLVVAENATEVSVLPWEKLPTA